MEAFMQENADCINGYGAMLNAGEKMREWLLIEGRPEQEILWS